MKFIVEVQKEDQQFSLPTNPCNLVYTDCALCSEDPRFCPQPPGPQGPGKR